jgi:hypothetical protein
MSRFQSSSLFLLGPGYITRRGSSPLTNLHPIPVIFTYPRTRVSLLPLMAIFLLTLFGRCSGLEMDYHYWSFMEAHHAHTTLPSNTALDAIDILTWSYASQQSGHALLSTMFICVDLEHLTPSTVSPPFTQEACYELVGFLRLLNSESLVSSKSFAAAWCRREFDPHSHILESGKLIQWQGILWHYLRYHPLSALFLTLNIIHVMVVEHIDLLITHGICSSVSFYASHLCTIRWDFER